MNNAITLEDCEEMFSQSEADGALLTNSLFQREEAASIIKQYVQIQGKASETKTISIENFNFNLIYLQSRFLRHFERLLFDLGIKKEDAPKHYELDIDPLSPYIEIISRSDYDKLPSTVQKATKEAAFFKYLDSNPKGRLLPILLRGRNGNEQKFCFISNVAPFCDDHLVIYADSDGNKVLKQMYHEDTLYWIDDLRSQTGSNDYRLFFTPKGAGNSEDILHYQYLKSPFPVFSYLSTNYAGQETAIIETDKSDWPFPGILARYNSSSKNEILAELDRRINKWLNDDKTNTFNLLFQSNPRGFREFFFIFRKQGYNYIEGIKNAIAGYEAGGNIIVEDRTDFDNFPSVINRLALVKR